MNSSSSTFPMPVTTILPLKGDLDTVVAVLTNVLILNILYIVRIWCDSDRYHHHDLYHCSYMVRLFINNSIHYHHHLTLPVITLTPREGVAVGFLIDFCIREKP
jgi:hypothetical protein